VVDAGGDPWSGEVIAHGVSASGEGDEAGGVDQPVDLDRSAGLDRAGADGWRSGACTDPSSTGYARCTPSCTGRASRSAVTGRSG
jgi:hypothetical protein